MLAVPRRVTGIAVRLGWVRAGWLPLWSGGETGSCFRTWRHAYRRPFLHDLGPSEWV